jgi:sialic acid synthase SpsE
MNNITLGNKEVNRNSAAFIIAEIGINHQGNVQIAEELILKAKEGGADAVKFQKRSINRILTKEGLDAPYNNRNSFGETYGEHKQFLELTNEEYHQLFLFCKKLNIIFCASGWDEESIDFLDKLGVPFFKMASADLTNIPLLLHASKKNKPLILSTGMANMKTVELAYSKIKNINSDIAILQCTSTYPSSFSEINLNVIQTYLKKFPNAIIGYSGHEQGIAIPIAAVAIGARIIERHFTLDRTMKGGDHAASLEPQGFSKMVRDIRHVEEGMGTFDKKMQSSEIPILNKLGKSIVSKVKIASNEIITDNMLTTKGPGTGISPMLINKIIGKKSKKDIDVDQIIMENDLE